MSRRPRPRTLLLVLLLVVMINLPLVHSSWTRWRVARSGTHVTASVAGHDRLGTREDPEYYLTFRLPEDVDADQREWTAQVDRATYDEATDDGSVGVRVLPGHPSAYTVDGQVTSSLGLVVTLAADIALLLVLALAWRFRGRPRAGLHAVALADVERCKPGSALERLEGEEYLIRGEVSEIRDGQIVLDLGDRAVTVTLDGHHNPVGYQQPAQVRGRLVS